MERHEALYKLNDLIEHGHSRRITPRTREYWRGMPTADRLLVVLIHDVHGSILSGSGCRIKDNLKTDYALTVTLPDHRNKGYGRMALKCKVDILQSAGIEYRTVIAEDNIPSIKISQYAGLKLLEVKEATRESGAFFQHVYSTNAPGAQALEGDFILHAVQVQNTSQPHAVEMLDDSGEARVPFNVNAMLDEIENIAACIETPVSTRAVGGNVEDDFQDFEEFRVPPSVAVGPARCTCELCEELRNRPSVPF